MLERPAESRTRLGPATAVPVGSRGEARGGRRAPGSRDP
jgi:hypothetical protein